MDRMRFLELFLAESREHLAGAYETLAVLEQEDPTHDAEALRELLRHGHSLKGMASTMGFASMVGVAHSLEDLLEFMQRSPSVSPAHLAPRIHDALAALNRIVEAVERGESAKSAPAERIAREISRAAGRPVSSAPGERPSGGIEVASRWAIELTLEHDGPSTTRDAVYVLRELGRIGRVERVDPPTLDGDPPRFDGRLRLFLMFDGTRARLERCLERILPHAAFRLHPAPREDRPVLARSEPRAWARVRADLLDRVLETVLDLISERGRALAAADDTAEVRQRLGRCGSLLNQLYRTVMELRLEPFGTAAYRLNQCVRQLAADLGKDVQFRIVGSHIQLDRSLLDSLVDPLEQMVRNALDHGLETPQQRIEQGKPAAGKLVLSLDRRAGDLVIVLEDDGRGLCPEALRRQAIRQGRLGEDAARRLRDDEALLLVTQPAFSTATRLTETSGRGMGLDVARDAIERLGGRFALRAEPGRGCRFEVRLPLNLALIRALLVRCGGQIFALPVSQVDKTLDPAAVEDPERRARLDERLGLAPSPCTPAEAAAVLVTDLPGGPLTLDVDEVIGQREITVKPLPPPLDGLSNYSGAALLEDGSIALVVDVQRLWRAS